MRRIRIVAFCIAAGAVLFAVAASSAEASGPTWWECAKAEKVGKSYTGNYNDKLCSSPNAEGKGKYVLQEGSKADRRFKGKGGPAALHVQTWLGDTKIECAKTKDSAVPLAPNLEADVEIVMTKCTGPDGNKCTSAREKAGEIRLAASHGELGYLEESPAVVGLRVEAVEGNFNCGNVEGTISGEMIATVTGDVNAVAKEDKATFLAGEDMGTIEYEGDEFAPIVNPVGFGDELAAIGAHEVAPHVLQVALCGQLVEMALGEKCAPPAYAGLDLPIVAKTEGLMVKA